MKKILLFLMFISYLIPILYICNHYSKDAKNLSSIILKKECQSAIILCMISMGIFMICYEIHYKDMNSLVWIICAFIGTYLAIFINEYENHFIHLLGGLLILFGTFGFMIHHCIRNKCNILYTLLILHILLLLILSFLMNSNQVITAQILLIVNFSIFYIYLISIRID